jgi:poly-beta-1,6-N-acetyl-D-glucosamine synthase
MNDECGDSRTPRLDLVKTKYVVITPVRDEAEFIRHTLDCMLRQTVLPYEWIIVDDGSSDRTGAIIDEYASRYSWVKPVHRRNRGFRKPGGGVVEAFNDGYKAIETNDWDFITKFDGDLSFEPDYFERCFRHFEEDRQLGVGGGVICYIVDNVKVFEGAPRFHVRGATKIYRRECWNQIGGLWPAPGWDTIDEIKANSLGWRTSSFNELHLVHHRPTGEADGFWKGLVKYGRANYICGYHPLFMLGKCVRRLAQKPVVVGACGLMYGYLTGYVHRIPQVDDRSAIAYLRRQQLNRLVGRPSIWD